MAAAPGWQDGTLCSACQAQLPKHTRECPYRRSLSDSVDTMSGVAAPLLAGFSIGFIGIVITATESLRWPGWTLLPITLSALLLIMAVQSGFWVRHFRPDPDSDADQQFLAQYAFWLKAARWAYNAGIALLLVGLSAAIYPRASDDEAMLRRVASSLAALAAAGEVAWAVVARRVAHGIGRRPTSPSTDSVSS